MACPSGIDCAKPSSESLQNFATKPTLGSRGAEAPLATLGVRGKEFRLRESLDRDPNSRVTSTLTGDAVDDVPASSGAPPMGMDGGVCWCVENFYSVTTTICMTTFLLSWGGSVWYVTIPGCQRSDIFIATRALSPYGFFNKTQRVPLL